jgi:hypothetical protein
LLLSDRCRIWSGFGFGFGLSALPRVPRRVATWHANGLFAKNPASTPPHRPIELFAYNFFDCRHRGSLAASTQVIHHAPRVRRSTSAVNLFHLRTTV